jgi:hypothetical protein
MRYAVPLLTVVIMLVAAEHADAGDVLFWNDADGIHSISAQGGPVQDIADTFEGYGLAVDGRNRHIYWTDTLPTVPIGGAGRIRRAAWDGTGRVDLVGNLFQPAGLTLDLADGRMYWSDIARQSMHVANLDGSEPVPIGQDNLWAQTRGMAFDPNAQKIYFTYTNPYIDVPFASFIARIGVDGRGFENVVGGLGAPETIALDLGEGMVYWADPQAPGGPKIERASLDGTNREDVVTGLVVPHGVALNTRDGIVYWTDNGGHGGIGKLQRRAISGGPIVDVLTNLKSPGALALHQSSLLGDANGDGVVDRADLVIVTTHYGTMAAASFADGDFNGDGAVSLLDVEILQSHYSTGELITASAQVPEPSASQLVVSVLAVALGVSRWRAIFRGFAFCRA